MTQNRKTTTCLLDFDNLSGCIDFFANVGHIHSFRSGNFFFASGLRSGRFLSVVEAAYLRRNRFHALFRAASARFRSFLRPHFLNRKMTSGHRFIQLFKQIVCLSVCFETIGLPKVPLTNRVSLDRTSLIAYPPILSIVSTVTNCCRGFVRDSHKFRGTVE